MRFEEPGPKKELPVSAEVKKRFATKLEAEQSLDFMPKILKELPNLDFYLVGGMVRDTLLHYPTSKDYDFIARGVHPKKMSDVLEKHGRIELVGKSFGVYKFVPTHSTLKEAIDIAIPRTEESTAPGSYRSFKVISDHTLPVSEDLDRRDLTINAIAWDVKEKELIDPHNGMADLKDRIVRCVGDPRKRFEEDYSRMLRAIRFACRFDFAIEEKTWAAIQDLMPHINDTFEEDGKQVRVVPREIISREIQKALKSNPVKALDLLETSGALAHVLPEVAAVKNDTDAWEALRDQMAHIGDDDFRQEFPRLHVKAPLLFSTLFTAAMKQEATSFTKKRPAIVQSMYKEMHLTNKQKDVVDFVLKNQDNAQTFTSLVEDERLFFGPHADTLRMALYLQLVDTDAATYEEITKRIDRLNAMTDEKGKLPAPLLNGKEIMDALNHKGGKIIGQTLQALREKQLAGEILSKEEALDWVKKIK